MKEKLLTDVELEMMTILWQQGKGTVGDVLNALPKNRKLAYTSVSTILRILEKKNILSSQKEGRGHVYLPLVAKEDYEVKSLKHLVDHVFSGTPTQLVRCLLETKNLSEEEIREIRDLLDKRSS